MHLQAGVFPIRPDDFARVVEVWEASVRATHDFVSEADIQLFRPLVRAALPHMPELACVRDAQNQVAGFIAVENGKVEMLFIHPAARGQGAGRDLLSYAITTFGATDLDVNEQNPQAVGFYTHMGFQVVGRSERDGMGKPYPLLHLRHVSEATAPSPTPADAWMPRERWDALVRGDDCPLCQELRSSLQVNQYGATITDLPMSRLRLASNQFIPGYCVLICSQHVQEPYHLPRPAYLQFFADMTLAAQALERVFQPIKMNFQLLGNAVPHLHAHIVPRYYGDPAPGHPIDPGIETLELTAEAREARVQAIRAAIKALAETAT